MPIEEAVEKAINECIEGDIFEEGQKAECLNTERERRRADKAGERAQKAEVEVERLKKELAR